MSLSHLLAQTLGLGVIGMCIDWSVQAALYIRRLRSGRRKHFRVV